jgi:hypothetical protein
MSHPLDAKLTVFQEMPEHLKIILETLATEPFKQIASKKYVSPF